MSPTLPLQLAWRYIRGRRSVPLHGTARAALVSTSLGVTAMVLAMALMTGYSEDLQRKLVGGSAAIVAHPLGGAALEETQRRALEEMAGVVSVASVSYGQGSVSRLENPRGFGVVVRGVAPDEELRVHSEGSVGVVDGVPGAILGVELARSLGAERGEVLRLVGVDVEDLRFRYRKVRFTGTFEVGFADADAGWMMVDGELAREIGGGAELVEIALDDPMAADEAVPRVEEILGEGYLVTDWRQFNRELFTALSLQKLALFLVLGLIVVVGTFNVASTLVVLNRQRRREVGVLTAMGLGRRKIESIFLWCGLLLGIAGSLIGVALGWAISWTLTTFEIVSFDPGVAAIYFISSVPFRVQLADVAAILAFSLAATLLASWFPARRAARVDVTTALRYD
ncbi:MAG: ABC transporter permease [Acidobacteriota bacterium]|nr:ABC transporter permease [Acidobacteriota bacterium]